MKTQIAWHNDRQEYSWGLQVDKDILNEEIMERDRIIMLKFGLDGTPATEEIRNTQLKQLQRIPSKPSIQDLIRVYLQELYLYAKGKILDSLGQGNNYNIFDGPLVESIICVPALWTPEMNSTMIDAALFAGIPNPDLVSEPEAAAALVIQDYEECHLGVVNQEYRHQENPTVNVS